MTDLEKYFIRALKSILENISEWKKDYVYLKNKNEFAHKDFVHKPAFNVKDWFKF